MRVISGNSIDSSSEVHAEASGRRVADTPGKGAQVAMMPSSSEISFMVSQQPVSITCDWGARSPPSKSASPPSTSSASTSSAPVHQQCSDPDQLRQWSKVKCRARRSALRDKNGFMSPCCGDWVPLQLLSHKSCVLFLILPALHYFCSAKDCFSAVS